MSAASALSPGTSDKSPRAEELENDARWRPAMDVPCQLTVELAVPAFRVSDFLALRLGAVISTRRGVTGDLPLRINGTLIGWGELEGAGNHLAVRLTELA
jgi:flagellar motor switch/type III secretory pathway protein FliN